MYEFEEVSCQNNPSDDRFDAGIEEKLKCYVYILMKPDDRRVFYVGKGGGKGDGNSRVFDHFDEAEQVLNKRELPLKGKVRAILETWKSSQKVAWLIVRHGLTEREAEDVEAALIDTLPLTANGSLENLIRGQRVYQGLLSSDEVGALSATPASPNNAYPVVFVFQIQNALSQGRSLYEATRGNWSLSQNSRSLPQPLAVGVANGLSKIVCGIYDWETSPPGAKTYAFNGNGLGHHELLNRNFAAVLAPVMGFLMRGGGYIIVEFDGGGRFRVLRGSADKTTWHSC